MKYRTSLLAAVLVALSTALPQESTASTPLPMPSTSAAAQSRTIFGLTITPAQNQTTAQQNSDGQACYQQAKTSSGVDPAHIVKATPSPLSSSTSSSNATQMASQAASTLTGAQTLYQQEPPQTQQGKPMKAFKKAFKSCMQMKGYTVTKKGKG